MSDSDIIREVEEDLQRERLENLWKKHASKIIGVAVALLLAVAGYQYWQSQIRSQNEAAGAKLVAALDLAREGKAAEADTAFRALLADAPVAYQVMARLRLASAAATAGKTDEALAAYEAIGKDQSVDKALRDFSLIQAATLRVDKADFTEIQNRLTTFVDVGNGWRHSARELLGLSAMKAGKLDEAESQFQLILGDRQSPAGLSQRAQMMLDVLLAGKPSKPQAETVVSPATPPVSPVVASPPAAAGATKQN